MEITERVAITSYHDLVVRVSGAALDILWNVYRSKGYGAITEVYHTIEGYFGGSAPTIGNIEGWLCDNRLELFAKYNCHTPVQYNPRANKIQKDGMDIQRRLDWCYLCNTL